MVYGASGSVEVTRREQIEEAAKKGCTDPEGSPVTNLILGEGFISGAEWADANPSDYSYKLAKSVENRYNNEKQNYKNSVKIKRLEALLAQAEEMATWYAGEYDPGPCGRCDNGVRAREFLTALNEARK